MQPARESRNPNQQFCMHTKKEKLSIFVYKKKTPPATKHSLLSNDYNIKFYRNLLTEYSLIGIVKPKFSRGNEI